MTDPIEHNKKEWDRRVREGMRFTRPLDEEAYNHPEKRIDHWAKAAGVRGKRVLCLGAGGGRQGPLYAAAGATVMVVDISDEQLAIDRKIAAERALPLKTLAASMDDMPQLADAEYDIVIQPVSTCYIPDLAACYREVARVMRTGGLYISQHKQPTSLQADIRRSATGRYDLMVPYTQRTPLPEVRGSLHREAGTTEFLHTWSRLIGDMCRAGFVIEDLAEPDHTKPDAAANSFEDRSRFIPPYVRLRARRMPDSGTRPGPQIFVP